MVGGSTYSITILHRATGSVVWHLHEHLQRYGEPKCYIPEPLPTPAMPCFQQQHVYPMATPYMLVASPEDVMREDSAGPSTWSAVHPDHESDTLIMLSQEGLLLFRHYSAHLLHGAAPELIYLELPLQVYARAEDRPEDPLEVRLPAHWGLLLEHFMPGQLAVGHGRAFMTHGMLMMLDLKSPSFVSARYSDGKHIVPFSVYLWTDVMTLERRRIHAFPYWSCSCVQMDLTGIYCVSTQVLRKEIGTDPASFPPDYELECHIKNSTMTMAFRFDIGDEPRFRSVDLQSYDEVLRNAEERERLIQDMDSSSELVDNELPIDLLQEPWSDSEVSLDEEA